MVVKKKRTSDIVLGSFVAVGLVVLVGLVFLIGKERRLFDSTVLLDARFPNVAGLAVGADVMLSGVVVGNVKAIKFPKTEETRDVTVVMKVSKRMMPWIKDDSIARVDSKGLLGDKLINITIGSVSAGPLAEDGHLKSQPPLDFNKAFQQAQEILESVTKSARNVEVLVQGFVDEGGSGALASSAKTIQRMLKELESGHGVLHELIYDKAAGNDTRLAIKGVRESLENVAHMTKQVRTGNGMLHALIYDPEGSKTVTHLNQGLTKLSAILGEVKDGSGVVHDLIYASDKGQFIRSLNKAALDLEHITADLKDGKGSLGLLLKDPSLYNELYGLIGNLGRNRLLKAVIRSNLARPQQ